MGYLLSTPILVFIVALHVSIYTVNASCIQTEASNILDCSNRMLSAMGLSMRATTPQFDLNKMLRGICSPSGRAALRCMADVFSRCPEMKALMRSQGAFNGLNRQGIPDVQSLLNSGKLEQTCSILVKTLPDNNANLGHSQNDTQDAVQNGNKTATQNETQIADQETNKNGNQVATRNVTQNTNPGLNEQSTQNTNQGANQPENQDGNDKGAGNLVKSNLIASLSVIVLAFVLTHM